MAYTAGASLSELGEISKRQNGPVTVRYGPKPVRAKDTRHSDALMREEQDKQEYFKYRAEYKKRNKAKKTPEEQRKWDAGIARRHSDLEAKYPGAMRHEMRMHSLTGVMKSFRLPDKSIVRFRTIRSSGNTPRMHLEDINSTRIEARHKGKNIGNLILENEPRRVSSWLVKPKGTVRYVQTDEDWGRKGIATKLWHHAVKRGYDPKHDLPGSMSPSGRKWAMKVSGGRPTISETGEVVR